ncbi:MAG TPA: cation:proton antiporter [Pseudonocardia sp.]|nr:cation:proton antiporter [Pseudonocardia sp.]
MDARIALDTLLVAVAVSVAAPLVLGLLPRLRVPQVVLLLAGGVLVGPQVLALGAPVDVQIVADVGLGFVFLLAGYEVDLRLFGQDAGRRAIVAWLCSVALAVGVVGLLELTGLVRAFVPVAVALTTTALGTLLPVLRESGMLAGRFGRYLLAAGAVGELFPVLAIALFLGVRNRYVAVASLAAVGLLALVLSLAPRLVRPGGRLSTVIAAGRDATTQTTLRGTLLLLIALLAITDRIHLDSVLGAFLAGMVLRRWAGPSAPSLEGKLDAIAFGFFVPVFFVYSGMGLDLRSIGENPLRLVLFFALMVLVRGVPALPVYRRVMTGRQRLQTVLVTATTLPLLVALTEIGTRNGTMLPQNAAALVGAGALTVLVLPTLAVALNRPAVPAPSAPPDRETGGTDGGRPPTG